MRRPALTAGPHLHSPISQMAAKCHAMSCRWTSGGGSGGGGGGTLGSFQLFHYIYFSRPASGPSRVRVGAAGQRWQRPLRASRAGRGQAESWPWLRPGRPYDRGPALLRRSFVLPSSRWSGARGQEGSWPESAELAEQKPAVPVLYLGRCGALLRAANSWLTCCGLRTNQPLPSPSLDFTLPRPEQGGGK